MRIMTTIGAILILISCQSCITTSEVTVPHKGTFPTVTGTNLHGEEQTLPACLTKDRTIVVVAFERWQQTLCDGWYKHIGAFQKNNKHVGYYEIPTIAKLNPFVRWFIYRGMRGGIEDDEMRRSVVTLHIDKEPFKKGLGIESEDTVHIYIMDKDGKLIKYIKGKWTLEKWQEAVAALENKS
jgi:hypothetical protein